MRTTVDLPDDIYRAIKVIAAERGTTVRELVLEGLGMVRARTAVRRKLESPEESAPLGTDDATGNRETNEDLIGFP
jgi:hypothetical protein